MEKFSSSDIIAIIKTLSRNIILFIIVKIASPSESCIHVGNMIDCPHPEGRNISIFGGIPQWMKN